MALEMAIWRMTDAGPQPLVFSRLGLEQKLEDMIVQDPSLTGMDLLVIGRQVNTAFGGQIDVLAADIEGHLHILELKRDKTPRDVVAQALDYGSWVQDLTLDAVSTIYAASSNGDFEDAFAERFATPVPDVFNAAQQITIVASQLDSASDRIVTYLAERYGVPLNTVFFRYFADAESEYLARTWLIAPEEVETKRPGGTIGKVRPWNGQDFYVVMGSLDRGTERWAAGSKYGFVGAGGGEWYWKPLRNLLPGKRIFAYVGGAGYVGVGEVNGPLTRLSDLETVVDGHAVRVVDQPELSEGMRKRALSADNEVTEYAVPVQWLVARPASAAVMERGLFASQVTACKLRDDRTIAVVSAAFNLDAD